MSAYSNKAELIFCVLIRPWTGFVNSPGNAGVIHQHSKMLRTWQPELELKSPSGLFSLHCTHTYKCKLIHVSLPAPHLYLLAPFAGFVRTGLGAVPLQRGQHDRFQAAEHRQPVGSLYNGQVGHGKTAGSKTGEWPDGWRHDCKPPQTVIFTLWNTHSTNTCSVESKSHLYAEWTFEYNCKPQTSANLCLCRSFITAW